MKYINQTDKLKNIKFNKDNFYVLIDFDRTITESKSFSAWRVLYYSEFLGKDFKEQYMDIHIKTEPDKNATNEVKEKAFEQRFKEFMNLLKECHFSKDILEKSVKKTNLKLREGAKEFFKQMYNNHIPVIIISSSIKNVIEEYLKQNDAYYDNMYIYANYYDMDGIKEHYITNVTPYNKNKIEFSEKIKKIIKDKTYTLLLGDLTDDVNMVSKEKLNHTITIGFLEENIESNIEKYNKTFDIVLTNRTSFQEVLEILNF